MSFSQFPARFSRRQVMLGAVGGLLVHSVPAWAQPRRDAQAQYTIFDADVHSHRLSRIPLMVDEEHKYQIFIAEPVQEVPDAGYPVIYMLDGNAVFDRLTPELLAAFPGLVIVGVGYPADVLFDSMSRSRDYTPPLPAGFSAPERPAVQGQQTRQERPSGGASQFLEILQNTIRSKVEANVQVDPYRSAIWGHSYGGLFCLYTLLTMPDAFARYIPVSASSGWGGNVLMTLASQAKLRDVSAMGKAEVLIMLGDSEARRGTPQPIVRRPSPTTIELVKVLRQRADVCVEAHILKGLGHGATFTASFMRALTLAAS